MNTARVDISYRPLRIGWLIHSEDRAAFRTAARWSFALWGGCFNPIIPVDQEGAASLVELFRVDVLWPVTKSEAVTRFAARFPHLGSPFFPDGIFVPGGERSFVQVLDLQNMLAHQIARDTLHPFHRLTLAVWQPDDPLADVFLAQFGRLPSSGDTGIDYQQMLQQWHVQGKAIGRVDPVPGGPLEDSVTLRDVCAHGVERHWRIAGERYSPAVFVGDASSMADLICYWNLCAADIQLWFVDLAHQHRYDALLRSWEIARRKRDMKPNPAPLDFAVWSRMEDARDRWPAWKHERFCHVTDWTWNGCNLRVPTMHLGTTSSLGVVSDAQEGQPVVSFALGDKPFSEDSTFHNQHLVASLRIPTRMGATSDHTFTPPYVPELNKFVARETRWISGRVRLEPERLGVVVGATDRDLSIRALSVPALFEQVLALAGYRAKLGPAGLLARQLIRQLGSLQAARIFKIPGVRRVLHEHGPRDRFGRQAAEQQIQSADLQDPGARFPADPGFGIDGEKPKVGRVFEHLVEKGLLRIGVELTCPTCRISGWTGIDTVGETVRCEFCGAEFDARRQLAATGWSYRRSGVFGAEKNAMGAIPVVLTLQQLDANLEPDRHHLFSPSLELESIGGGACPDCEVDFVWLCPRPGVERVAVILGECKDRGRVRPDQFARHVDNLRQLADRFPPHRFETFVLIAKLADFTPEEIELAKRINEGGGTPRIDPSRLILLTHRELEPYGILERWNEEDMRLDATAGTPEGLVRATWHRYFRPTSATTE